MCVLFFRIMLSRTQGAFGRGFWLMASRGFCESEYEIKCLEEEGLYGWGHGDRGQLGQGEKNRTIPHVKRLQFKDNTPDTSKILFSKAQEDSSFFICRENGRNLFYGVGSGLYGNSGFISKDPIFSPIPFTYPNDESHPLLSANIRKISEGRFHVLFLTENGEMFVSGSCRQGQLGIGVVSEEPKIFPVHISSIPDAVRHVAGGSFHSLAITENGDLYTWGANISGQLGHGDMNPRYSPEKIQNMDNIRTGDTSVFHSLVVTEDNKLFGWGHNKSGQLGAPKPKRNTYTAPFEIKHQIEDQVVKICCGTKHNILLTSNGDVFSFGDNTLSQLGYEFLDPLKPETPHRIDDLSGLDIDDIVATTDRNFAISRKQGKVYGWGYAPDFQFGVVRSVAWETPKPIFSIPSHLKLQDFSAGIYHSFVTIKEK